MPASARARGAGRPDAPPHTPAVRVRAGFASVLAAVQDQDDRAADVPGQARVSAAPASPRPEAEPQAAPTRDAADDPVVVAVPEESQAPVPVQTPWLLLALGTGTHGWQERLEETSDADGEAVGEALDAVAAPGVSADASAVAVALPVDGSPHVTDPVVGTVEGNGPTIAAAVMPAATDPNTAPDTPATPVVGQFRPEGAVAAPLQEAPALPVDMGEAPASSEDPGEPVATEAVLPEPSRTRGVEPQPVTSGSVTPDVVADPAAAPGAAAEQPGGAKWQVRADVGHAGSSAGTVEVERSLPPVHGLAARRLAQSLGQPGPASAVVRASVDAPGASADASAALSPVDLPASRAPEVLLRLAQAGVGQRPRQEGADGAPSAQVLAVPSVMSAPLGATAPSPEVAPLPAAVGEQVLNQVVSSLRMQWKDGVGEARLQLRPDALGQVSVTLKVEAGAVTAVVRADSPEVQEWVVKHQQTLREQMEAAGLRLDELVVSPDDRGQQGQQAQPDQRRRRQPVPLASGAPRFEQLL